ncbi:cysteine-rich receptor-like protein kinase 25 [Silene latifolia]|uniref:cysteine-rich receptor-like protein kinase 25 n=1 Tax=Silene latifolia TaxID=37657 RepID=UPI003D77CEE0
MSQVFLLLIYFQMLIIMINNLKSSLAATYFAYECSNTTMLDNIYYQSNLYTLFYYLTSNATNRYGYHAATAGIGTNDVVYGSFLCRGDQNSSSCQDCVKEATTDLPFTYCPYKKVGIMWYDECMVRYSNESFFGIFDYDPGFLLSNPQNVTGNLSQFKDITDDMFIKIAKYASRGGSEIKYGTGGVVFTSSVTVYGFAQCTPDLGYYDCMTCLVEIIGDFAISTGSRVLRPSCSARFEIYQFFNGNVDVTGLATKIISLSGNNKRLKIIVTVTAVSGTAIVVAIVYFLCRRKARQAKRKLNILEGNPSLDKFEELPLFKFEKLSAATNNFQESNKLGQGGFGPVYKGTLEDGQEVAIKRLSGISRQGAEEFMNEVLVISKLQHRNLVKLLACCVERRERMLIYEYMPNRSLDAFLFDDQKKGILDWKKRYSIIEGICRALLYLHRDSHLKIIHRDLKAANILLDENLNPKISDFGMARIFGGSQIEADTTRVVGTYGYMPPEYAIEGRFSEKSDIFSYGVLLLEIITGKKTRWFDESSLSLLGYVWKQWNEDNEISLIDPIIAYQGFEVEISKCIHVGLLCVQEYAQDRPDISDIIAKLGASSSANFQKPRQPGFTRFMRDTSTSTQSNPTCPTNDLSITNISGR